MPSRLIKAQGLNRVLSGLTDVADKVGGDAVYLVGSDTVYGVYLETGTSKMPSYPWLRPAVNEFNTSPKRFVERHGNKRIDNIGSAEEMVEQVALALEMRMKDNVNAGLADDRSPETEVGHPKVQTGNLRASIQATRIR